MRFDETTSVGAAPSICTTSSTAPTCSFTTRSVVRDDSTRTPLNTAVWNPFLLTVNWYEPNGRSGNTNTPELLVAVSLPMPVPRSFNCTRAFCTTPPFASDTVPAIAPAIRTCAQPQVEIAVDIAEITSNCANILFHLGPFTRGCLIV